jgi:hypothetical protein
MTEISFLSVLYVLAAPRTKPAKRIRGCSFLRQQDSWNRIQISFQGFITLMRFLNVFHPFWAFVKGFGLKFEPQDEYYIDYKSRFSTDTHPKPSYKLAIALACLQIFPPKIIGLESKNSRHAIQCATSTRTIDLTRKHFGQNDKWLYTIASMSPISLLYGSLYRPQQV